MANRNESAGWIAGVGLLSGAVLGLEIALANVFGVLMQYHYVSLLISLAVFGIGAGSYAAWRSGAPRDGAAEAAWMCAAAGIYIFLLSITLAKFPYVGQILVYALLGIVPYVLFGWVMGRALRSGSAPVARLYAADLLGAGVGAAGTYALLDLVGGFAAIAMLSALCFAAWAAFLACSAGAAPSARRTGTAAGIVLAAALPALVMSGALDAAWRLDFKAMKDAPPDKTIVGTLQSDPGAKVIDTDWDSFARTDLVQTSDDSRRILFVGGGAGSYMYKFDGNLPSVSGLARDIEFLPFAAGAADKTAIVGAGGGRDILYALLAGAKDVTAVELSRSLVDTVRAHADYNGGILDRPGVHTVVGDGRTVLERSSETYDLIVLDLVYSQVGGIGGQTLAENYVFTREAFEVYLNRLNPDGRIAVISHQGIEGIRAYYTGFEALLGANGGNTAEAATHTALLMAPENSASPNLTLSVIQRSPLREEQLSLLKAGSQSLGLNALFLPGENELLLKPLLDGTVPFDRFVRDGDFKVFPTTDDRPFFFQVQQTFPPALMQWLSAIAVLTALFVAYAWFGADGRRGSAERLKLGFGTWMYFVLLGIGYMCVQTAFIQKAMIYAGSPTGAATVIIVAMLAGGSAGSILAGRRRIRPQLAAAAFIVLAAVLILAERAAGGSLLALDYVPRMAFIGLAVFLLGVLLGIPLPAGLEEAGRRAPGSSPLLFAINGIAGIWGSWLAVAVSLAAGLTVTLLAGCLCYAVIAIIRYRQLRRLNS